ncbi:MAG TPA: hypothetical protein VLF62_00760 [Candidatus Saccharimonadales bacterium]|nr:hypothetical protein [Candidatus Saccharimonadales bacterium]
METNPKQTTEQTTVTQPRVETPAPAAFDAVGAAIIGSSDRVDAARAADLTKNAIGALGGAVNPATANSYGTPPAPANGETGVPGALPIGDLAPAVPATPAVDPSASLGMLGTPGVGTPIQESAQQVPSVPGNIIGQAPPQQ